MLEYEENDNQVYKDGPFLLFKNDKILFHKGTKGKDCYAKNNDDSIF